MRVLDGAEVRERAVEPARGDDRELGLKSTTLSTHGFLMADEAPDVLGVLDRRDAVLALAVVAERRRS